MSKINILDVIKEEYLWHKAGINSYKKESHGNTGNETYNNSNKELGKWDMQHNEYYDCIMGPKISFKYFQTI